MNRRWPTTSPLFPRLAVAFLVRAAAVAKTKAPTFFSEVTAAVRHFEKYGFKSQAQLEEWVSRLRRAALLSLKKRPLVRYQRSSEVARRIGQDIYRLAYQQEAGLFDFRRDATAPVLLILDRLDDPLTPLLTQWTYQAMVHELLGISSANTVDLSRIDRLPADQKVRARHCSDIWGSWKDLRSQC